MWLDAVVTSADLKKVVEQLTPATVPLGSRGHLFFDATSDVSLVAERGLRIRCHAKLLWPVLGIDVAITVTSMTLMIVPSIESRDGARLVVFSPEVEALDLALLPDIGDAELRAFINRELSAKRVELPWNYKQTLDHQFALPEWFRAGATFDIRSNGAAVQVTNDAIGLAINLSASVGPNGEAATDVPTAGQRRFAATGVHGANGAAASRTQTSHKAPTQRRPRLLRLGLAVAGGFSLGCLVGMRHAAR
jgi:hypothetical protein